MSRDALDALILMLELRGGRLLSDELLLEVKLSYKRRLCTNELVEDALSFCID